MKRWHMCLYPQSSDHRPSVPLGLFCPVSEAHDSSWLERSREGVWHLLSGLVVWFFRTYGWVVIGVVLRWRKWGLVVRLMRGTELQSAASRLSIWLTHRLSSGPGSWDLLCKGLRLPEYLSGPLPVSLEPCNFSFSHWQNFQCTRSKIYFLDGTGNVVETNKGHTCIHFPSNVT